ncbi:hypothetical protein [Novosphingobium sp. SG707]|uniref:hypothetical protein n=1 Tax=Novosphingobium sp. SG707 TaxID=2586996 RepID=UPI00144851E3|nr:hypothetical protein [Novosphingobium sp. SG707]NKJ02792.1 hypothetical protein [Novosphingobium sp. SG707]
MIDPYEPKLDALVLSADEVAAISAALATSKPWDWTPGGDVEAAIKSAKNKIRDHHLARHRGRCCYCRTRLKGGGHFMIDREHILPKSKEGYRQLSFTLWNLAASCKRCNMQYKKNDDDFVVNKIDSSTWGNSDNYALIHPNFDYYSHHMRYSAIDIDDRMLVKFTVINRSKKGEYTYNYFNLRGLEENQFDRAQGGAVAGEPVTELTAKAYELALILSAESSGGNNYKFGTDGEECDDEIEQEDNEESEGDEDCRDYEEFFDEVEYEDLEVDCGNCNGTGNGSGVSKYLGEKMRCGNCEGSGVVILRVVR